MDLRARPSQRLLYSGWSLLMTDAEGAVNGIGVEGFYVHNTRLLSRLDLRVGGATPRRFASCASPQR